MLFSNLEELFNFAWTFYACMIGTIFLFLAILRLSFKSAEFLNNGQRKLRKKRTLFEIKSLPWLQRNGLHHSSEVIHEKSLKKLFRDYDSSKLILGKNPKIYEEIGSIIRLEEDLFFEKCKLFSVSLILFMFTSTLILFV